MCIDAGGCSARSTVTGVVPGGKLASAVHAVPVSKPATATGTQTNAPILLLATFITGDRFLYSSRCGHTKCGPLVRVLQPPAQSRKQRTRRPPGQVRVIDTAPPEQMARQPEVVLGPGLNGTKGCSRDLVAPHRAWTQPQPQDLKRRPRRGEAPGTAGDADQQHSQ
jgi:hypothetical protein